MEIESYYNLSYLPVCLFGMSSVKEPPMVRSYATLLVWAGESQCGNPIGSELVLVRLFFVG